MDNMVRGDFNFLTTGHPMIVFEDNEVGRLKKEIFDAPMSDIEKILKDYEIPSEPEIGKGGCYIQTTPRAINTEKRR